MSKAIEPNHKLTGWLWLAFLAGSLATLKRFADLAAWETRFLILALSVFGLLKLLSLFRQQTTSPIGIAGVVCAVMAVGAASLIGIPDRARQLPSLMDIVFVIVPLLLFLAAVMAGLVGLAKWRGPGEFAQASSKNRLPIVLNLVLAATAWQVVRQATARPVLHGVVSLPYLQTQRTAVEQMVGEMMGELGPYQAVPSLANLPRDPTEGLSGPAGVVRPTTVASEPWVRARDAERKGDKMAAAEAWVEAADAAGHDPVVEATAIRALVLAQRRKDALGRVERLRLAGFESPDLTLLHGYLLAAEERLRESANVYEPVLIANHGSDDEIRRYLGILVELGETARALRTTERILIKRPNRRIHRWRACLQAAEGDYDNALATLRRLTLTVPFEPLDAYRLGEIANDAGRPQVALSAVSALMNAGENTVRTTRIAANAYNALGLPMRHATDSGASNSSTLRQQSPRQPAETASSEAVAGGS